MKIKSKVIFLSAMCSVSYAFCADPVQDQNLINEHIPQLQDKTEIAAPSLSKGVQSASQYEQQIKKITDEDLKQNIKLTNFVVNQAVIQQDWKTLRRIIQFYNQIPGYDPILYDYVRGAIYRQDGQHKQAIKLYRNIVEQHPDLSYMRLDLAAMLFENRAYNDSQTEFERVLKDDIVPNARTKAQAYLSALRQQDRWKSKVAVSYGYNSNINNATNNKYLYIPIGTSGYYWILTRDAESLPQSGHVAGLSFSTNKDYNVQGNHFINLSVDSNANIVKEHREFNDANVTLSATYKYQDIDSWLEVGPWVNRANYHLNDIGKLDSIGFSTQYGHWLTPKWQMIVSSNALTRKYDNPSYSAAYDGETYIFSTVLARVISPRFVVYANLGVQKDDLSNKNESSKRFSSLLGVNYGFKNGIQTSLSTSYAYRKFDGISVWTGYNRKDDEYQINASLWKQDLKFWGITPKFLVKLSKTDSNVYVNEKDKREFLIRFEKDI
ncbi:surface lipoprotein assembly modifier [Acinetobacter qingfengensis]|nr:surface lipoprotein assembly modifier [Acinetobacter qingfengensis]